jgi:hypothetical protein
MIPLPSLARSSCLPTGRTLHRHGQITVFRVQLVAAEDGVAVCAHEIIDGSNVGDRYRFGEGIYTELGLKLGNEKCQIERAQSEGRVELVRSTKRAHLTKPFQ